MAIRHQKQSDKYPYASPTTPGLYITFRSYIIELICLNVNNKIGPRFWSDPKYWGPKFRREVKGVDNVLKSIGEEAIIQTAFVEIIKQHNIKSLLYKTTAQKVIKSVIIRKADLIQQRNKFKTQPPTQIDERKNSTFVDTGKKGILDKIRKVENG